jgi:uncharacterized protein GlcG (DUF336 family)
MTGAAVTGAAVTGDAPAGGVTEVGAGGPGAGLHSAPDICTEVALALVRQVHAESRDRGLALAAAVVDRGGNLVASARMDGCQLAALALATDKAYTAVAFGHPTSAWADSSRPGGSDWGLAGGLGGRLIVYPGGVPLYSDGHLIGALGVSGTASLVDEECASTAAAASGLKVAR